MERLVYVRTQELEQTSSKDRPGESHMVFGTNQAVKQLKNPETPRLLVQNVPKPLGFRSM